MQIVYARQLLSSGFRKSLYLAGPTPRDRSIPSWRPDALATLTRLGYDGREHLFTVDQYDEPVTRA